MPASSFFVRSTSTRPSERSQARHHEGLGSPSDPGSVHLLAKAEARDELPDEVADHASSRKAEEGDKYSGKNHVNFAVHVELIGLLS